MKSFPLLFSFEPFLVVSSRISIFLCFLIIYSLNPFIALSLCLCSLLKKNFIMFLISDSLFSSMNWYKII